MSSLLIKSLKYKFSSPTNLTKSYIEKNSSNFSSNYNAFFFILNFASFTKYNKLSEGIILYMHDICLFIEIKLTPYDWLIQHIYQNLFSNEYVLILYIQS